MKQHFLLVFALFTLAVSGFSQRPRMFLDVPAIYAYSANLEAFEANSGLAMDIGFGLGSHNLMTRLSGGTAVTADFQSDEIEKTVNWLPFVKLEAGAGLWRSNGNKCSRHHSNAFTAIAKGATLYAFDAQEVQFTVGAELGYFRIRDYKRNMEIFMDGGYNVTSSSPFAAFGLRYFLNLRA